MQQAYLDDLRDDDWPALVGVDKARFQQIYQRYCRESAINKPYALVAAFLIDWFSWKLFRVLFVLKTNPTWQQMRVETNSTDRRTIRRQIMRHTRILADRMAWDVERMWAARREFAQAPDYARRVFGDVTFLVDTFPVIVQRASQSDWRRGTYSGKYKQFVLKCQVSAACVLPCICPLFLLTVCLCLSLSDVRV